jgi:tetraacyldisaccharide 4'-kinase
MSTLERNWWSDRPSGLWLALLAIPSLVFRMAVALRSFLYGRRWLRVAEAPAPVISVGNLAVGGAGKTPVAIAVARRLQARGRTVAILSRGYGASASGSRVVADGAVTLLDAEQGGDEPVLVARRLPGARVLCGPRRAELAQQAVQQLGADALLLDDGLQHRALARDLDLVVLDAAHPVGNGWLLPAGPNREPVGALRRAGLVWLSRVDQADPATLERWRALALKATGRPAVESRHAPLDVVDGTLTRSLGVDALRGRRVLLLSGLARPGAFRRTVEGLGATVALERRFPDHHRFTAEELGEVFLAAAAAGCERVVTTEKDAVRLDAAWATEPLLAVVRIEAEVLAGEGVLEAALDEALARAAARAAGATT